MSEKTRLQINPTAHLNTPRGRNAARVSPLSGRHCPTKYTSPLDTQHLMTPDEFQNQYIRNKPGNRYTDKNDVVEIPKHGEPVSPQTPITPLTGTSTQRSETQTSLGSSTYQENEEHAPTGCFGFGKADTRKRSKDDSSDEFTPKSPKKLRRNLSWKAWFKGEKE